MTLEQQHNVDFIFIQHMSLDKFLTNNLLNLLT